MSKYTVEQVKRDLEYVGVKFSRTHPEADASRMNVVGIGTLGKLDFLNRRGYTVYLPVVEKRPEKGYRGLKRR